MVLAEQFLNGLARREDTMPDHFGRRRFLRSGLVLGAGMGLGLSDTAWRQIRFASADSAAEGGISAHIDLTTSTPHVHDPVIIRVGDIYYLFCTGAGIPLRTSTDLVNWKIGFPSRIFRSNPDWTQEMVPGSTDFWAPDISYFNNRYHLYYSVSTFGRNRSAIGLATSQVLNPTEDGYGWVDEGLVLASSSSDNYNCIDPNVFIDTDGVPWLSFGSFWTGIKMRRLDESTGKPSAEDRTLYSLAQRFENHGAVEAPFIMRKGDYYYLFVSFDFCCRGVESTYRVMVGRSRSITGPYVDRDDLPMLGGGGTQVTYPTERWRGPGHNAILQEGDKEYIVYHAYDAESQGAPTLRINPLIWDDDGWPSVENEE